MERKTWGPLNVGWGRKFVDPQAEFLFVPADKVIETAEREGAIPYDVPNVEFGHHARGKHRLKRGGVCGG